MPTESRVVLTLASGQRGKELLAVSGPALRRYAARVGGRLRVLDSPAVSPAYPLAGKFAARQHVAAFGRTLFLDADVILHPDCPDLFAAVPADAVGMYDDTNDMLTQSDGSWLAAEYAELAASQGVPLPEPGYRRCLNSGVIVCSRGHAGLFDPPAKPYPVKHCSEQNLITLNLERHGYPLHALPRDLNHQWWADPAGFDAATPGVKHFSGLSQSGVIAGAPGPAGRLKAMREYAGRIYPARPACRHRSPQPVQYAGGCCGQDKQVQADSHEYECDRYDARCCDGFGLLDLAVRRCRVCPGYESDPG